MLIDNKFLNNFWVKVMDTTNYLQNRLPKKRIDKNVIIPKEA